MDRSGKTGHISKLCASRANELLLGCTKLNIENIIPNDWEL